MQAGGIHVGVAGDAQRLRSGGDQLYSGNVFSDPDFVATCATGRDRRMYVLTLGFIFVTLNALG